MKHKSDFRVVNVICSGKLPDTVFPIDNERIIKNSKYVVEMRNEEICPILAFSFVRNGNDINIYGKKKCVCASIWTSGSINIVGLKSLIEGKKFYRLVVAELIRLKQKRKAQKKAVTRKKPKKEWVYGSGLMLRGPFR